MLIVMPHHHFIKSPFYSLYSLLHISMNSTASKVWPYELLVTVIGHNIATVVLQMTLNRKNKKCYREKVIFRFKFLPLQNLIKRMEPEREEQRSVTEEQMRSRASRLLSLQTNQTMECCSSYCTHPTVLFFYLTQKRTTRNSGTAT